MKKILVFSFILFLYGCSNTGTESTGNDIESSTTIDDSSNSSSEYIESSTETSTESESNANNQSLNIGAGGFDPTRPRETAEFIKEFFYIDDEIISNNNRRDGLETLKIGDHNAVIVNNDGYIYGVSLGNLYKSEVEQVFEELNITDLSEYTAPLEADTTNFEEGMTSYSRAAFWDNVAVGLQLNTNIDKDKDKPYAMIIAFDKELIDLIKNQNGYF